MIEATLLLCFATAYKFDYFATHSTYVLYVLIFLIAARYKNKYRPSFLVGMSVLLSSCLFRLTRDYSTADMFAQTYFAGRFLAVAALAIVFTHITRHLDEVPAMRLVGVSNVVLTLATHYWAGPYHGYFENTSTNTASIGVLFPYFGLVGKLLATFLFVGEACRAVWLMLLLYLAAYIVINRKWSWAILIAPMSVVAYWKSAGKAHVFIHDRLEIWQTVLSYWWSYGNIWFGDGVGSFFIQIPRLQRAMGLWPGYYYTTAHNDFVQWTYETGVVGGGALLWMVIDSLYMSYRSPAFYSLLGMIVFASLFFPLEMPAMTVLWVFLMQRQLCYRRV